jgi:hypothetical protein
MTRSAFHVTNRTDEPITSGLPVRTKPLVRRIESSGVARGVDWR